MTIGNLDTVRRDSPSDFHLMWRQEGRPLALYIAAPGQLAAALAGPSQRTPKVASRMLS
jgi:hypothetical protein